MRLEKDIFKRLQNPIRLKILYILSEEENGIKPTKLLEILKISPGTLYYHLDVLGDFINKKKRKIYISERGKFALKRAMKTFAIPRVIRSKDTILIKKSVFLIISLSSIIILALYIYSLNVYNAKTFLCLTLKVSKNASILDFIDNLILLITLTFVFTFIFTRRFSKEYILEISYMIFSLLAYPASIPLVTNLKMFVIVIPLTVYVILNSIFMAKIIGLKVEKSLSINLLISYIALTLLLLNTK